MLDKGRQTSLEVGMYSGLYDILIEKDNFWRQINETVDFSFIYAEVKQNYSETAGRPAECPILLFKLILLKTSYKLSDRDLIARLRTDMQMKYFLEYEPEETEFMAPSLLSKFRHLRLKNTNLLDLLLTKTVEIALDKGVIEVENKLIQDSTHSNAMFQHVSPREEIIKRAKEVRKAVYAVAPQMKEKMPKKKEHTGILEDTLHYANEVIKVIETEGGFDNCTAVMERMNYLKEGIEETEGAFEFSKDQEAKVGHKTADTAFFGYKTHLALTPERIVTAATITSGEKPDGKEMKTLVEKSQHAGIEVKAIIGDGAYSETDNLNYAKANGMKLVSKLSKSVTHGNGKNKDKFAYNKDAEMYVCLAGHMAIKKRKSGSKCDKKGVDSRVEAYFFDVEKCKRCPFREGCYTDGAKTKTFSVKIKSDTHIAHMDYMETEEFKELYKERYKIEAKNAELKGRYNYGTAQSCGLLGMTIQGASTLFLANMKRIIKLEKENTGK
ncbi:hypothetical protein IGI37_003434 [Enterococcus sp. AZ194]|uniref:IS1182 family transposase n=1 Tax=Enterococcus sp. AZ194 TaxID=2774629 RepID=UPI003F22ACC0